jgi:hypothetical protein
MPRTFSSEAGGLCRGNITVLRTTIKLNQCQGHFLQKQVASVGADGWLDADWEDTPSGNITAITTAMKLN